MTSLIIAAVVGLVVGIGGTIGIQQATKPKEEANCDRDWETKIF